MNEVTIKLQELTYRLEEARESEDWDAVEVVIAELDELYLKVEIMGY